MPAVSTLYNPQEVPEEQFLKSFVVRRALLDELLGRIRAAAPGERFEPIVLQGQRGQGKTTLLRKIALCVRDDPALSPWLIPILFREEEYSVVALCRLWERTADYLAERPGFERLPDEFEAAVRSPHYEAECFDILARALERENQHLLLLIDNFGEMLDKFGKADQQRFRDILLTSRRIRIVAGSAATLEQHYDPGKPFFDFFRLRTLEGLNAQEARDFMLSLGNEEQKKRMAEILETRPGKLEALRRLTAGVPRTLALLFEIFLDDDGGAMENLDVLLDRVTPLYKHRLDDLPTQQQAIVYEIAMGWDALSVKEIAAKTRLPSKHISAQLQLLEKNRVVMAKQPKSTKNKLYQLEERFFNIWCLMRLGRSGDKRRAVWLVRFLEIWCDDNELEQRVIQHIKILKSGRMAPNHALLLTQAFVTALGNMDLQEELLDAARLSLGEELARALPDSDKELWHKATNAYEQGMWDQAIEYMTPLARKGYLSAYSNLALAHDYNGDRTKAVQIYRIAADAGDPVAIFNIAVIFHEQKKYKLAEKYYVKAVEHNNIKALVNLGALMRDKGNLKKAKSYYKAAAEAGDPLAMLEAGKLLQGQKQNSQAESYYKMAIDKGSIEAMIKLGELYEAQNNIGLAKELYELALNNGDADGAYHLALIYFGDLDRANALVFAQKAEEISGGIYEKLFLSFMLLWAENFALAFQKINEALTSAYSEHESILFGISKVVSMLAAKNQTPFALKLFEDEQYAHINLKERLKPLYYAILREAGPARADDALRMGPELEETVEEIRREIDWMRQAYHIDPAEAAGDSPAALPAEGNE